MSIQQPTRRFALALSSGYTSFAPPPSAISDTSLPPNLPLTTTLAIPATRRSKWSLSNLNPFRTKAPEKTPASDLDDPMIRRRMMEDSATPKLSDSIFEDEVSAVEQKRRQSGRAEQQVPIRPQHLAPTSDPDPQSRQRWERKMVIRMVRRNGAETRSEIIRRTEREMRYRSPYLATSVKKLVHLARQITDRPLEDALIQMQYSKKKMARRSATTSSSRPKKIKSKDGSWLIISDPSRIYIAQAWVGRGPWRGSRLVHLGRGRKGTHQKPSTSISFVLKEENTRIREYEERLAKEKKQGPWIHLPNRPISAQRQYYTW
ncbi:unnamed protein product [Parascedosporium putredinis]|uniref:Ribosomal protein L22 n=1 Tax=Parascedosporium putredinis TaxID=1442378 RepID=A0A9P1H2T8_9PEZI|nr:unnamed protein product [Parascedosporium putredinis]CAI7995270.1 unnamed protein product [Parascedosporium putredinis]